MNFDEENWKADVSAVRGVPRIISCADEDMDFLALPRGCIDALIKLLDEYNVPCSLEDRRNEGRHIDAAFTGTLRPEQEPAAEALLREVTGVLSATTAFGKTVIGAYLIGKRRVNTLILYFFLKEKVSKKNFMAHLNRWYTYICAR